MSDLRELGCFIETAIVSNGNQDGSEVEAAAILDEALETATINGIKKVIDCKRCGTSFSVYNDGAVFLNSAGNCDRAVDISGREQGNYQLNINLSRLTKEIIW